MIGRGVLLFAISVTYGCGTAETADRIERTIRVGGLEREYIAHLPSNPEARSSWPVILAYHAAYGTASQFERGIKLHEAAGAEDFVVVYPNGVVRSWNAGWCCGTAERDNVDDIGFTLAILKDLERLLPIRTDSLYLTGFSNGAVFSYHFACRMADRVAAIAPAGASHYFARTDCQPTRPVPILHIHGLLDTHAPFKGGEDKNTPFVQPSVPEGIDFWAANNRCRSKTTRGFLQGGDCTAREDCSKGAEVVVCTVPELGHNWPGREASLGGRLLGLGPVRPDVDANAAIIAFFKRHGA